METRRIVTRVAGVVVVLGALLGAGSGALASQQASQQQSADRFPRAQVAIEGVWLPIVTITDCETQAVIATFPAMEIYLAGGGYVGFGAVTKSDQVGMGAWRHVGGRNYRAEYQFFTYGFPFETPDSPPDGNLLEVSETIRLNAAGTAFTSITTADLLDSAGNVLARTCGRREARRLQ
jgi:hypothetical protein